MSISSPDKWYDGKDMLISWLITISIHVLAAWLCLMWAGPWGMLPVFAHLYWVRGPLGLWALVALGLVAAQVIEGRAVAPNRPGDTPVARLTLAHLGTVSLLAMTFGSILGTSLYAGLIGRHYPYDPEETFHYLARRIAARLLRTLTVVVAAGFSIYFIFSRS